MVLLSLYVAGTIKMISYGNPLILFPGLSPKTDINLIYHNEAWGGKFNDAKILESALTELGFTVQHATISNYFYSLFFPKKASLNIFIERVRPYYIPYGGVNAFIPNPEVANESSSLPYIDLILCRTKEVEKIFAGKKPTYFLGFTSLDRYEESVPKVFNHCLHLQGKSTGKGSLSVVNLWNKDPSLPPLTFCSKKYHSFPLPKTENFLLISSYIQEEMVTRFMNRYGIHLCPSRSEGFGHYISEAMSAKAVILTTNAPPMNEFITDPRCLIAVKESRPNKLAVDYFVDEEDFHAKLSALRALPETELLAIGEDNRARYLKNQQEFKARLAALLKNF
jgi:hypothetical protein